MISFIQKMLGWGKRPAQEPLDFNDLEQINKREAENRTGGKEARRERKRNPERRQSRPPFLG